MNPIGQTGKAIQSTADESGAMSPFGSLNQQQLGAYELLKGLAADQDQFHDWYYGALRALELKLPDYLAQAAHSIRELCDRLPGSIATIPQFDSPLPAVKALAPEFESVKTSGYTGGWVGKEISKPLSKILIRLENIYQKCKEPPRTARLGLALATE